jgi:hypothetical protein
MPDELGEALQIEMLAASLRADQPLCKTSSDVRNEGNALAQECKAGASTHHSFAGIGPGYRAQGRVGSKNGEAVARRFLK